MSNDQILKAAESLVREILQKDLHQRASQATVKEVALKVAKVVPKMATTQPRASAKN